MNITDICRILKDDENLILSSVTESGCDITGVCFDSREAEDGNVFVAISGVRTDGHLFVGKAIEQGASVVICENREYYEQFVSQYTGAGFILVSEARRALALISKHFYSCACDRLSIIGITGTKGKTSTSFMISEILNTYGQRCGIIGTTGAYFGDFFMEMDHSTPESRDLHKLFAKMLSLGATHVVMEVSSQALMMHRVYGIRFSVGIFTNISPDHIGEGEHKDFEDYLFYKSRLFTMCDTAVINADADRCEDILAVCGKSGITAVTYSCKRDADYRAYGEEFYIDGGMKTHFELCGKDGFISGIEVNVPGKFSVFNALCATSVCMSMGADIASVKQALSRVKVIGRIEPVEHPLLKAPVIIDYAHNAMSLESLFTAVKAYNPKRIICVFGCGGNRSKLRRYEMGEVSGKYADLSIITADNSRFEELDDIIADILTGMGKTQGKYEIVRDRKDAIYRAIELSQEGDIVLLAGKGQETYLDVKGVKTHFDEREVVKSYFDRA